MPRNAHPRSASARKPGARTPAVRNGNGQRTKAAPVRTAGSSAAARGRPPKMVYINVLVKASTRSALTRLKSRAGAPSQGAIIDGLVAKAVEGRETRGRM